jgi:hypothetical protein
MKKLFLLLIAITTVNLIHAQDTTLQQYTGKYVFPEGGPVPDVEVILSGDGLSMTSAAGSSTLLKLGVDSFQIVEFSGTSVFKRGEDKKVNAVHIEAMGYVMDGQKQSTGLWIFTAYYRPEKSELLNRKK